MTIPGGVRPQMLWPIRSGYDGSTIPGSCRSSYIVHDYAPSFTNRLMHVSAIIIPLLARANGADTTVLCRSCLVRQRNSFTGQIESHSHESELWPEVTFYSPFLQESDALFFLTISMPLPVLVAVQFHTKGFKWTYGNINVSQEEQHKAIRSATLGCMRRASVIPKI